MEAREQLEAVKEVLQRHRADLMQRYRASGVAVGKSDAGDDAYAIVVYLASATDRPSQPESIEGVPLKFVVTGPFRRL